MPALPRKLMQAWCCGKCSAAQTGMFPVTCFPSLIESCSPLDACTNSLFISSKRSTLWGTGCELPMTLSILTG